MKQGASQGAKLHTKHLRSNLGKLEKLRKAKEKVLRCSVNVTMIGM